MLHITNIPSHKVHAKMSCARGTLSLDKFKSPDVFNLYPLNIFHWKVLAAAVYYKMNVMQLCVGILCYVRAMYNKGGIVNVYV